MSATVTVQTEEGPMTYQAACQEDFDRAVKDWHPTSNRAAEAAYASARLPAERREAYKAGWLFAQVGAFA